MREMMANDANVINSNKKPRFNPMVFIRETQREISKVTWPTRKETVMTTVMIVVMALITGVFFFGVDTILGYIIGHLLNMNS